MRAALIRNNIVENVIEVTSLDHYTPREGYQLVAAGGAGIGWTYSSGMFSEPVVPPPTTSELNKYAEAARYKKEIGGITANGAPIHTDRASQAMINGAYNSAMRSSSWSTVWKTSAGFVTLTSAQIIAAAIAVSMHVEACFAKEAAVITQIAAGTITTTAQIDEEFDTINTDYAS